MNTAMTPTKKTKNNKLTLLLFILVIIGPVLFAWMMVQKGNMQQLRLSNHGDLITPPQSIAKTHFQDLNKNQMATGKMLLGKWWLVYVAPATCQQTCQSILYNMRQIRAALGKEAPRLERLFIAHPSCQTSLCETFVTETYPEMQRIRLTQADFISLFGRISHPQEQELVGEMYIIDPKGNIMMHYSADMEARAILSDIKRLLKVSKIG